MPTGRPKLLVADDSVTIQKVVTLTFIDEGMEVIAVGNGDDAIRQLEENRLPDIVLADAMMPGLSGYEMCRRIKGDSRLRHIPVMLLVGAFEPFNETEARRVGADDILTKPFQSIRDLVSKVGSLLGGSKAAPEAERYETTRQEEAVASEASPSGHAEQTLESQHNVGAQDDPVSGQHPAFALNPTASFADLGADDEMIEETPVINDNDDELEQTISVEAPATASASHADAAFNNVDAGGARMMDESGGDKNHSFASAHTIGEEVLAGQPAFSTHVASAAAADDALLDLGSDNTSLGNHAAEADDFVLDLDDMPAPRVARSDVFDQETLTSAEPKRGRASSQLRAADAFNEPAHSVIRPPARPAVSNDTSLESVQGNDEPVPVEVIEQDAIPQHQVPMPTFGEEASHATREFIQPTVIPANALGDYTDGSVEGDVARPPAVTHVEPLSATEATHPLLASSVGEDTAWQQSNAVARAGVEQLVGPEQLSPAAVDAIARRAVEMLSEKVIQEIAWEVVPQLAELLIKRRLDEERQK